MRIVRQQRYCALSRSLPPKKAHTEQFITTFARYYTPFVVFFAVALAIIPSLITGTWETWIYRSLVFLVVSCPCALVISVPLSYFAGIGKSASHGILVKGGNYLEALSTIDTMVFDKTGTLTHGSFSLEKMVSTGNTELDEPYLEKLAASLERQSNHPLARAFDSLKAPYEASNIQEIAGKGISALIDGKQVTAGNAALFTYKSIPLSLTNEDEGTIHLAVDAVHAASFIVKDTIRPDAKKAYTSAKEPWGQAVAHALGRQGTTCQGNR